MSIKTTLLSGSDAISANLMHSLAFFLKSSGPPIAQPHAHCCSIDLMYALHPATTGGRAAAQARWSGADQNGPDQHPRGQAKDRPGPPRPWAYEIHTVPSTTQANGIRIARARVFSCSFVSTVRRLHEGTRAQQESSSVRHICNMGISGSDNEAYPAKYGCRSSST